MSRYFVERIKVFLQHIKKQVLIGLGEWRCGDFLPLVSAIHLYREGNMSTMLAKTI